MVTEIISKTEIKATKSLLPHQSAESQTIPVRGSMDAKVTSCPQSAVNTQIVWTTVAVIMTTLAITTTIIAIIMGLLLYVKSKHNHSTEAHSHPPLGECNSHVYIYEYLHKNILSTFSILILMIVYIHPLLTNLPSSSQLGQGQPTQYHLIMNNLTTCPSLKTLRTMSLLLPGPKSFSPTHWQISQGRMRSLILKVEIPLTRSTFLWSIYSI